MEVNPGSTEAEHLGWERVTVLVSKLNGCVKRVAPLSTKQKSPWQVKLPLLIRDAQIRILLRQCVAQRAQPIRNALIGLKVLRRCPLNHAVLNGLSSQLGTL